MSSLRTVMVPVSVVFLLFLAGCSPERPPEPAAAVRPSDIGGVGEAVSLELDAAEGALVEEIRARGGLRVAISNEQTIYEELPGGRIAGLHYEMVLKLGELLDLPVEFTPVFFHKFFEKDGEVPQQVKTDPDYSYTPDLLRRVDFYAGTFSPLAWRRKFLTFVPVYHTRLIFISRRGEEVHELEDLQNRRVALIANTSYESWFHSLDGIMPADIEYIESETGFETIEMVAEGTADVTISDANLAIVQIREYPNLNVTMAANTTDQLCWAAERGDDEMASILAKYIDLIKNDGTFEALWMEYYGISTIDYLDLIGFDGEVR